MEIVGSLVKSLPSKTGTSAKGSWTLRSFLIETSGPYPKTVQIEVFGDKGDVLKTLKKGDEVRIQFDLESRESNGKYFTSVKAFKIEPVGQSSVGAPHSMPPVQQPQRYEPEPVDSGSDDSLPF